MNGPFPGSMDICQIKMCKVACDIKVCYSKVCLKIAFRQMYGTVGRLGIPRLNGCLMIPYYQIKEKNSVTNITEL